MLPVIKRNCVNYKNKFLIVTSSGNMSFYWYNLERFAYLVNNIKKNKKYYFYFILIFFCLTLNTNYITLN